MHDLRTFIETVRSERPRDIIDVHREVSPTHETAAILIKLEQCHRSPLLVFHRVAGSATPVVTNVCGSTARLALALGCSVGDLSLHYSERVARPIKPEVTRGAPPVQECVAVGPSVNLGALPQLRYHENDSEHPYITAAIVAARDPDSGKTNLSFHRLMITGRDSTCIFMARGKHLDRIYRKYEQSDEAMPIAAVIGVHPTCALGALYTGPEEIEEYDIVGALQRSPLRLTNCITQPLRVPAEAEIVLEGIVPPGVRISEGPFGEFTGYSIGTMKTPIFKVTAITSRRDPLFQDVVSGHLEHMILPSLGMEHHLLSAARAVVPSTTTLKTIAPLTVAAAIEKSDDSQPQQLIEALISHDIYVKQVIVVDRDVDVGDLRQLTTAIALHVRPDRDIRIYPAQLGTQLDPSLESDSGLTAKLGIDATVHLTARKTRKNTVPKNVLDAVNLNDLLGPLSNHT